MNFTNYMGVVLAAGKGTRMHSSKPKVLQTLLGEPVLGFVLDALKPFFEENILVIAGYKAELLEKAFPAARFVIQEEQLGTGHALMTAMPSLEKSGAEYALVVNGDTPLITEDTLASFLEKAQNADLAFISMTLENPGAYGRVARKNGKLQAIVEAKDFDPRVYGPDSGEVNAGIYSIKLASVGQLLAKIKNDNKSGEYYITELIGLALAGNLDVRAIQCHSDENLLGVNSPAELSRMEEILRSRQARKLLESGVIIHAPDLLRASPSAKIAPGVEITGPCEIYGASQIEAGAVIDSHCVIRSSVIHANAHIHSFSHLDHAEVGEDAQAGPFVRLRPGAILEKNSHAGNFVELKKAVLGRGAKANHLTYLGDAQIGAGVNIGAGTITCNYDGKNKFQTHIGENAFIGSNTALVAPVNVGSGALVGAGSVITKDVPPDEMAIARSRQKNLPFRKKAE